MLLKPRVALVELIHSPSTECKYSNVSEEETRVSEDSVQVAKISTSEHDKRGGFSENSENVLKVVVDADAEVRS